MVFVAWFNLGVELNGGETRPARSMRIGLPLPLAGCGKTPCKIRHRFDFLRPEQARRERLSDAREGSSEGSPGRPREPGGDGAGGSSPAADPPAGERSPGASVTCLR